MHKQKNKSSAATVFVVFSVLIDFFRSPVYLNNVYAGVQVDGSFGLLAVLLVLVGVEDVGAVGELRQVEVPPFEHLQFTTMETKSGHLVSIRL